MKLLIVSPRFPPTNAADCHRVRLLIPYLVAAGIAIEVLAVAPECVDANVDPWLESGLPDTVPIHRVKSLGRTRVPGMRNLSARSIVALYREGRRLLSVDSDRFDLVFFSTTEFPLHVLGPLWQKVAGVPCCMDFQDPWVTDYYALRPNVRRPGGSTKYAIASWIHRRLESRVVKRCAGFLAVSPRYLADLVVRYGERASLPPRLVAPFPADPKEFARLQVSSASESDEKRRVIRYVGIGSDYMRVAATIFFSTWHNLEGDTSFGEFKFEAFGTSYSNRSDAEKVFEAIAKKVGLRGNVAEETSRVPYSIALSLLATAHGIVVFGSDDVSYTASKLYPCLLAGPPVLAILQENSPAVAFLRDVGGCDLVTFGDNSDPVEQRQVIQAYFDRVGGRSPRVPILSAEFSRYSAKTQAEQIEIWLRDVVEFACSRSDVVHRNRV